MFRNLMRVASVAALSLVAVPASASSVFSSFVVFGDSLSDNGNLFAATNQPPAPYDSGRFSNGPVWNEYVMAQFAAEGKLAANFAFGGAKATSDTDGIPDLAQQIGIFAASVPKALLGKRPLATLWFGANDLLNLTGPQDIADAAKNVANGIKTLSQDHGIRDFLVVNLPDLGSTPRATMQGALPFDDPAVLQATGLTLAFNAALNGEIAAVTAPGRRVFDLDVFGPSQLFKTDPALLDPRLSSAATSCIVPGVSLCDLGTEANMLAFFDEIHPNAVVHEVIGNIALNQINAVAPIPLPAPFVLLAGALAGLGALRKARQTA